MRSNTRFSVALHVLSYLAWQDEPASSWLLATSVGTNPVVIRQLLRRLTAAGLVTTVRGAKGGARLAKDAAAITLREIHDAVDDSPRLARHPPNRHCTFGKAIRPGLENLLDEAEEDFRKRLEATSLADALRSMKLHDQTGSL